MKGKLSDGAVMLINAFMALALAISIYLFIRKDWFLNFLEAHVLIFSMLRNIIYHPIQGNTFLTAFLKNQMVDSLWSYALGCALIVKYANLNRALYTGLFWAVAVELFQMLPFVYATFDFLDIVAQIIGVIIAWCVGNVIYKVRHQQKINLVEL